MVIKSVFTSKSYSMIFLSEKATFNVMSEENLKAVTEPPWYLGREQTTLRIRILLLKHLVDFVKKNLVILYLQTHSRFGFGDITLNEVHHRNILSDRRRFLRRFFFAFVFFVRRRNLGRIEGRRANRSLKRKHLYNTSTGGSKPG